VWPGCASDSASDWPGCLCFVCRGVDQKGRRKETCKPRFADPPGCPGAGGIQRNSHSHGEPSQSGQRAVEHAARTAAPLTAKAFPWLTSLHEDIACRILSHGNAGDLGAIASTCACLCRAAGKDEIWGDLYNRHYGTPRHPSAVGGWKRRFASHFCTERNWRKGLAEVMTLRGHSGTVTSLAFDSRHIVSASDDGSMVLWEVARQPRSAGTDLRPPPALALAQLAQGGSIACSPGVYGAGNGAELHRRSNGYNPCHQAEKLMSFHGHGGPVWCLSVDFEGRRLVSGSYDQTVKCWDLRTGSCTRTLRGHSAWVSCVSLHRTRNTIVSGSWDATIKIWDGAQGLARRSLHCGMGNALYCLDWNSETSSVVAVGCRHRQVQLWDIESGVNVMNCHGHLKEVGAVQTRDNLIFSGSGDATVKVWDRGSGGCQVTLRGHAATVMSVQCRSDLRTVLSGSYDKTTKVWDLRYPEVPLHTFRGHTGAVFVVQEGPAHLLTGSADGTIIVHDFSGKDGLP